MQLGFRSSRAPVIVWHAACCMLPFVVVSVRRNNLGTLKKAYESRRFSLAENRGKNQTLVVWFCRVCLAPACLRKWVTRRSLRRSANLLLQPPRRGMFGSAVRRCCYVSILRAVHSLRGVVSFKDSNLVDSASSHTLVSKIKPCMSKYKSFTLKLRTAHYISYSLFDSPLLLG